MSQRLHTAAVGTVDGSGNVTILFDGTPQGQVWTGTVNVPASDLGGTWTAYIGERLSAARPLGSWLGRAVFGPVQTWGRERLLLVGSGLTAAVQLQAVLLGQSESEAEAVPASPLPFVSSLSLAQLVTGTLIVGPAGNRILIKPATLPGGQTEIEFDDGNTTVGHLRAQPGLAPTDTYVELATPFSAATFLPAVLAMSATAGLTIIALDADRLAWTAQNSFGLSGSIPVMLGSVGTQRFVQFGQFNAVFAAANAVNGGPVSFGTAFPTALDAIVLSVDVGANLDVNINAVGASASGFSWRAFQNTGVAINGTAVVSWVAVGH